MAASTSYVNFPSGCLARYSTDGTTYNDLGMLIGDTEATWNYDINTVVGSEGQKLEQYKNQTVAASFELADLNPVALSALSGGLMTQTTTSGSANTSVPDQVIAASAWAYSTPVNLVLETSSTDDTKLIASASPTITSVTGSVDSTLAEADDYDIIVDSSSFSGYSIAIKDSATVTTAAQTITIVYTSVTPTATTTTTAGHSTYTPSSIGLQLYSVAQGKIFTMYNVNVDSGSYNFGFKATDSAGADVMTLAFTGTEDVSRTNGDRLFSITETA